LKKVRHISKRIRDFSEKIRHISAKVLDIPKIPPKIFPKRARKRNDISIKRIFIPIIKTKKYNIH